MSDLLQVFALLDDAAASPQNPTSRLYTGFSHERVCADPADLENVWAQVESDQHRGLHAVMLADYEWGVRLAGAPLPPGHFAHQRGCLRVLLFQTCCRLASAEVEAWLQQQDQQQPQPTPAGALPLGASVTQAEFLTAIDTIQEAIRAGQTYQINHTYRLQGQSHGSPVALYRRLRARQPVAFGALMALPAGGVANRADVVTHILSLSPELFIRHSRGTLTACPMKGTMSRESDPALDAKTRQCLAQDEKNRAENLMIVDLLRNDLGRISRIGSVRVPKLFEVQTYATVFQMTSTVQSELLPNARVPDVLRALFPCGSITGAPKHRSLSLIAALENTPRDIYCGLIGWVDAPAFEEGRRVGDFCWSVAIRTATIGPESLQTRLRPLHLGIGAGIVLDSVAQQEFEECQLKARFLTQMNPGFALLETMRHVPGQGVLRWPAHLSRLRSSAEALGFAFDVSTIEAALHVVLPQLPRDQPARLRLTLSFEGECIITHAPLMPLTGVFDAQGRVIVHLSRTALPNFSLAKYKTTHRAHYDAAVRDAQNQGAFDCLFFNEAGYLLEGGRSNVFVKRRGQWMTPPLSDGVLPGILRAEALSDPVLNAIECAVTLDDLRQAEDLRVCNALRGLLPAHFLQSFSNPKT
jgi:para-aminobenzoate synthetase/4-amino-4-deoxychorismate lyase